MVLPIEGLRELTENHSTQRAIAAHFNTSQANVRHWLKKYGLKTKHGPVGIPRDLSIRRRCKCGESDPSKFYGRMWHICKDCHGEQAVSKARANREYALEFLGGKCARCPMRFPSALDIHHRDETTKDANFRTHRNWSRDRLTKELEKCELLCKNCHAIEHADRRAKKEPKVLN